MSLEKRKPKYVRIYRDHYPLYHESNASEKEVAIARNSITEKYKKFGISLNFDGMTFLD